MSTSAEILFRIVDVTANHDNSFTMPDKQDFSNFRNLTIANKTYPKYATLENDFWALDGTFDLFPDSPSPQNFALWSMSMSNETGIFLTPPVLTINFTEPHTSLGLGLVFDEVCDDWCNSLNIKWYGVSGLISSKDYQPISPNFYADNQIENYTKIIITFNGTSKPYRYLKLSYIEYGITTTFGGDDLMSAQVLEEVNLLSSEISINTIDFAVYSEDDRFNIVNPSSVYSYLQKRQQLEAYEYVNGERKYLGTYYLEEWESDKNKTAKISGVDLLGIIDKTEFLGGMYDNAPVNLIISDIMASAGAAYEIDTELSDVSLSGYIPICTHREALQQVAFAIGAIVDCSRSAVIKISKPNATSSKIIGTDRRFEGSKIKLKSLVTGVEVSAHTYEENNTSSDLYKANLQPGTYTIKFSAPAHALAISGGTIISSGANYAKITVEVAGVVTISGKGYTDNATIYGVYMPNLPAQEPANVLRVDDATMVSPSIAATTAQRIYNYYQQRYEHSDVKFVVRDEGVADQVDVIMDSNHKIAGRVEKMEINLTGGFVAKAIISGTSV